MTPNYELAATKALETLINHQISKTPVTPLPIIKQTEGVLAMPFADLAYNAGVDRSNLVPMFGENQDAVTFHMDGDRIKYIVAYNQYLPYDMTRRGLARELGHIVMGHDGTRPPEVRMEEAMCFARHLLFPRPLIRAIQESGIPFTEEVVGSITGCYNRCITCLKTLPPIHTPPELNRAVREQFSECVRSLSDFQQILSKNDKSPLADFGSYMDLYEE